jgi:hypothetical protein
MVHPKTHACTTAILGFLTLSSAGLGAQPRSTAPVPERTAEVVQQIVVAQDQDAREVREKLEEILRKLPPSVGRVLRNDPSLMGNEPYMATYPALSAYIKQHPEIRTNPGYFLEQVGSHEFWNPSRPDTPQEQAIRMWRDLFQSLTIAAVFLSVTFVLLWLVRTVIEYRRWNRASKVHTEVHNKLLDRFTANDDLMAYIQTPAGRRFLDAAPLSIDTAVKPVGAPFGRILWSLQAGIVVAAGALGLLFVSGRVIEEVAQPLFAIGVVALTVGTGFVVSAGASLLLSRRLGLFEPVTAPREHSDSAAHTGS